MSAGLSGKSLFYEIVFAVQLMFNLVTALVLLWPNGILGRLFAFPCYFFLVNVAAAHAACKFIFGQKIVTWKPRLG